MDQKYLKENLNLSDQDLNRIQVAKDSVKIKPVYIGLNVVLFLIFILSFSDFSSITLVLGLLFSVSFIVMMYRYSKVREAYNNTVKEIVIETLFKREFQHVNYNPYKGFEKSYIDNLEMIPKGNTYKSNDLLMGSYKGVGFSQADVLMQQVTSDGKTTTTTTYFMGRWIVVDFIKNFEGYHQVRSNGSFFKNKKPSKFFGTKVKPINFESVSFNKMFTSYTNHEKEAYYLVTPHMMEKMMRFKTSLNCEVIYGFIDNKLHLAIYNNKNAFEVRNRNVDESFIESVLEEIALIKEVIEELDLDLNLYK